MYLEKIEMQGFKSFADKTEIKFEDRDNITAIVGPNGSGKSNVSDAIRWVLGEQSAKSLRGGKMEDIIFSGTDKRRPLGYAEVTITFNNENRKIPIDYKEVAITRRVFRSGESEFYINKNACRLKDIRELFMDTGIGKDGYSIIGQGKIDRILSERPEDRRHIFEEAAGIVKYRSKKEDTERKLSRTDENLIRINDLLSEVKRQDKRLKKESEKAKKYLLMYDELKNKEVNIYLKEMEDYMSNLDKSRNKFKENSKLILQAEKIVLEGNRDYNLKLKDLEEIDLEKKAIEANIKKIEDLITTNEQDIRILKEKKNFQNQELSRLGFEKKSGKDKIESINLKLRENKDSIEKLEKILEQIKKDYAEEDKKYIRQDELVESLELDIESMKESLMSLYNESSQIKGNIKTNKSFNENINLRRNDLSRNIKSRQEDNRELLKSCEKLKDNKKKLNDSIEEVQRQIYIKKENYKEAELNYNNILSKIRNIQVSMEGKLSNYRLYQNMENEYDGYYKSVKNLLKSIDNKSLDEKGFIGVVADLIKVDKEFEKAIDVSLGSSIQNIVTETEMDAKRMIEFLRNKNMGRATFLPLNKIYGNPLKINFSEFKDMGVLGLAKDFVNYDDRYNNLFSYLLGRTVLVKDLQSGLDFSKNYKVNYRLVSLDGDIINPSGSMTGGSFSKNVFSIISRKNKIKDLYIEIEDLKSIYESENNNLDQYKKLIKESKLDLVESEEKIDKLRSKLVKIDQEINSVDFELKRNKEEIEVYKLDLSKLEDEIIKLNTSDTDIHKLLKNMEEDIKKLESKIEDKSQILKIEKNKLKTIDQDLTSFKIKINDSNNKKENINYNINILEKDLENYHKSIIDKNKLEHKIKQSIKDIDKTLEKKEKEVLEYKDQSDIESKTLGKVAINYNKLKKEAENIYYKKDKDAKILNEMEKDQNKLDFEISKLDLYIQNLNKNIFHEYELEYEDAKALKDKSVDLDSAKKEITGLKASIKRLGSINFQALEEYEEVNKRYKFLLEQRNDLQASKEDLEKVISDIEIEMEEKFKVTVKNINRNFSKIFKILFNGGQASINIENSDSLLDAGIEIEAQPPGKKLQNIRLLSGGEKSLTAVALLFAILELKPAPFCILDEIDAALDDANIGRYTDYLKSLNEKTQFILITHRKPTMEISDILYGVSMEDEGVSKLYSVKMKDFEKYNTQED